MVSWQPPDDLFHVWTIPSGVVNDSLPQIPIGKISGKHTVRILPQVNQIERCDESPDLEPYYAAIHWTNGEMVRLIEAAKIDEATRRRNRGNREGTDDDASGELDETDEVVELGFTSATVEFVRELPLHVGDGGWHKENKLRFQRVLRDPARSLVESLRAKYIESLSPEVAGGKRHQSVLKKNDFGKGGYHDFYWLAFYDPDAGSKSKSAQLFLTIHGSDDNWRYGFGMGSYCESYMQRFLAAIQSNPEAVSNYIRNAPKATVILAASSEGESRLSPVEFAEQVQSGAISSDSKGANLTSIDIIQEHALELLPDHDDILVDEVGQFFTWTWPFFKASLTGLWVEPEMDSGQPQADEDVDDDAPETLSELSDLSSLSSSFLDDLEQSLLAKQQVVLVGPPGTSKTFIARQFARYFVRQRTGRTQGSHHILYMHANWTYEDFFEGIKPATSKDGILTFQPQKGFFLEWVEQLKSFDSSARHVLVLDEINRCDTAAVLGELLQLLEYRGTTVRLLSGRSFVFPRNLYIIGTMNSADRSIGRMDLALRRRFLWLNLYPQIETLQRWLDRLGNNPIGFKSSALADCNDLLAKRGFPPEQRIGHALFMAQVSDTDDETAVAHDIPLTEKQLRRIVRFSVMPYVRELFTTQFGQMDAELIGLIRTTLLSCLNESTNEESAANGHDSQT